jgi:arylsulfatase A-like enzyme
LKGFKGNKFQGGFKVPFLVHWPAALEGGQRFDGMSSSLDLFPTFLSAAGNQSRKDINLDGTDLLPYLRGQKKGSPHEQLFFRKEIAAATINNNWKLIRLDGYGYVLYDLETDPYETNDLKESYPERFEQMKAQLAAWESKTITPRWNEKEVWQKVTFDIHKDLMNNESVKRLQPN